MNIKVGSEPTIIIQAFSSSQAINYSMVNFYKQKTNKMNAIVFTVATILAAANAGLLADPAAVSVVRTGLVAPAPIAYAAVPTFAHAAPVANAFAPLTYSGPAHIRIARGIVTGPSVLAAPLAYAQPGLVHATPAVYAAPVAYHAPLAYSSAVKTVHGHFLA